MTTDNKRVYGFSFVDTSNNSEPVIHQVEYSEGVTYPEVIKSFLGFLSEVYGYDVSAELLGNQAR